MERVLILDFIPPTLNEMVNEARTNKFVSAKTKKHFTDLVHVECLKQKLKPFSDESGIIHQEITFYVSNFNRDWDNLVSSMKYINDGLVKAKVIRDDNLKYLRPAFITFEKCCKKDERVEITMR